MTKKWVPFKGSVSVEIALYYGRNIDVDNYCKALLDGMSGGAYVDDKQVTRLTVVKEKATGGEPKAVVVVTALE